jgi:hypothetical protein
METLNLVIGIIGSLILVTGAAWPEGKAKGHPAKSVKNLLLGAGGFAMLLYAIIGYMNGGSIFFIFLQVLIAISTILMMLNTDDRLDLGIISISALGLIIWSLTLFTGYNTIIFIFGLTLLGLGYVFQTGTLRRQICLTIGSAVIAIFSYIEANWIFFGLNVFFSIFSGYYLFKTLTKKRAHVKKIGSRTRKYGE